ncbi:MAG: flavin reductase [Streptosporangiales bacterium]|nr:flavin reductase [Streptosporangiales bacterium]
MTAGGQVPEQGQFRESMSLLAVGVTIVTTTTPTGPAGMTASAVCSLSLEPPQLLACIQRSLPTHRALGDSGSFAVNVLGEEHVELARRFATYGADRFAGVPLVTRQPPVLSAAIAYFSCTVVESHPGGDHSIFVGTVTECGHQPGRRPLLYFDRRFGALEAPEDQLLKSWSATGPLV